MKWFVILWALPLGFLGSWYTLSYYDINFGLRFFSRDMHDLVFQIYGSILGLEPEEVPGLVLKAIIIDTALVVGLIMLKRRGHSLYSAIRSFFSREKANAAKSAATQAAAQSEASLSSAP